MKNAKYTILTIVFLLSASFILIMRLFPDFAEIWSYSFVFPVTKTISGISSTTSIVILELSIVIIVSLNIIGLLCGFITVIIKHDMKKLANALYRLLIILFSIIMLYSMIWYPVYFSGCSTYSIPDSCPDYSIEKMCASLIDDLNSFEPVDSSANEILSIASQAMEIEFSGRSCLKAARYPEWLRFFNLSGFYSPWTGEAIVDTSLNCIASLPFTAIHELMHLNGFADEGQANISAYETCLNIGDDFEYSAKLWAIKYGFGLIDSGSTRKQLSSMMSDSLFIDFVRIGGTAYSNDSSDNFSVIVLDALGIRNAVGDYSALARYLAADYL